MSRKLLAQINRHTRFHGRTDDPVYLKLARMREKLPRYEPGRFQFPFGELRYADIASLESQYLEIFVQRGYAFTPMRPAPRILDCGANIGLAAIWFAKTYPDARITAFEPGPELHSLLRANLEASGFAGVDAVQAAVWNENGEVPFGHDRADAGRIIKDHEKGRTVPALRLADHIGAPVDLLKLDVEGAEFEVVLDLAETGKLGQIQALICEVHALPEEADKVGELILNLHGSGMMVSTAYARSAPALFNAARPTPFEALSDGKYLMHLYAWREPENDSA